MSTSMCAIWACRRCRGCRSSSARCAVILGLIAALVGYQLYKKATTNTVVAYFSEALALYPGDRVQIMGVQGRQHRQDRTGRRQDEGHLPLRQQVQGARRRHRDDPQPEPGRLPRDPAGPGLHRRTGAGRQRRHPDRAHPGAGGVGRPAQPDLRHSSPNSARPRVSPRARSATSWSRFANGLRGQGRADQHHVPGAVRRGDRARTKAAATCSRVLKSLALFVNALHKSDQQLVALNTNLATFTNSFTNSDQEVANGGARTSTPC